MARALISNSLVDLLARGHIALLYLGAAHLVHLLLLETLNGSLLFPDLLADLPQLLQALVAVELVAHLLDGRVHLETVFVFLERLLLAMHRNLISIPWAETDTGVLVVAAVFVTYRASTSLGSIIRSLSIVV